MSAVDVLLQAALFFFVRRMVRPGEVLELVAHRRSRWEWWHVVARARPDLAGMV